MIALSSASATGLQLRPGAVVRPAVRSELKPPLVIGEAQTTGLVDSLRAREVTIGGTFQVSPLGVQVWTGPWASSLDSGTAELLGIVDWSFDTPVKHYVTLMRVGLTEAGLAYGLQPEGLLTHVLEQGGLTAEGVTLAAAIPLPRDPFRR